MNLNQCVAVVTGAGGGIGRGLALALARRGCHLALADVNTAGLAETVALLAPHGVRVSQHALDVTDRAAVAALPDEVLGIHGQVDLLFNNAGVAVGGLFSQVSEKDFDWLMEINFHAVVRMTRAFLPLLRERPAARVVNISSLFGLIAPAGQTAYSASKFAVRGFSNALAHELAMEGSPVGVTVAHPGGVATSIARNARIAASVPDGLRKAHQERAQRMLKMPPDQAGEIIVAAAERGQRRVIVGNDAKFMALMERLMPVGYWRLLARAMSR